MANKYDICSIFIVFLFSCIFGELVNEPCSLERRKLTNQMILPPYPVVYEANEDRNEKLASISSIDYLINNYGNQLVILSSSNTYSYEKTIMPLREYLRYEMHGNKTANQTYYFFGNNYDGIFKTMESLYVYPPCQYCKKAGAVTLGMGGRDSGVSFHYHGPGFSEVIIGRKRWFLYPPSYAVSEPNMSQSEWVATVYPKLIQQQKQSVEQEHHPLLECVIHPGEILYFPDRWLHGTLNLEPHNFFVSLFLDPQLMK